MSLWETDLGGYYFGCFVKCNNIFTKRRQKHPGHVEKIVNWKRTIDVPLHPIIKPLGVEGVAGSNPVGPTIYIKGFQLFSGSPFSLVSAI